MQRRVRTSYADVLCEALLRFLVLMGEGGMLMTLGLVPTSYASYVRQFMRHKMLHKIKCMDNCIRSYARPKFCMRKSYVRFMFFS